MAIPFRECDTANLYEVWQEHQKNIMFHISLTGIQKCAWILILSKMLRMLYIIFVCQCLWIEHKLLCSSIPSFLLSFSSLVYWSLVMSYSTNFHFISKASVCFNISEWKLSLWMYYSTFPYLNIVLLNMECSVYWNVYYSTAAAS